jgi:hypothetical protein
LQHIWLGKTRRMLEALTKYWGFYLVAIPDINGVGVRDFQDALNEVPQYLGWVSDLQNLDVRERADQEVVNSQIASKHLKKVLAARIVVFQLFLQTVIQVHGTLQEKHKRIWLLFQLSDQLFPKSGLHPFVQIFNCLHHASSKALDALVNRLHDIIRDFLVDPHFILGLDKAQQASRMYPCSFISSNELNTAQSIICEVVKVFTKLPIKLIVSGTGVSLQDLQGTMASGVSKSDAVELFHKLGMFDTWPKLKSFVDIYIPPHIFNSSSGHHLEQRMKEYLQGR